MKITKPIIALDLETTSVDTSTARIVEIAIIKIDLDGNQEEKRYLINPEMPIPPGATAVHGITDHMVAGSPKFKELAKAMLEYIGDADIIGFNSDTYDVPLLVEEFTRAGLVFDTACRNYVDVLKLERHLNPNTLSALYERYSGKPLDGAHGALADTRATLFILFKIIEKHFTEQTTPEELDTLLQGESKRIDLAGKLMYNEEGVIVWAFSKNKGMPVLSDVKFLNWVLMNDFPSETKNKLRQLQRDSFDSQFQV